MCAGQKREGEGEVALDVSVVDYTLLCLCGGAAGSCVTAVRQGNGAVKSAVKLSPKAVGCS